PRARSILEVRLGEPVMDPLGDFVRRLIAPARDLEPGQQAAAEQGDTDGPSIPIAKASPENSKASTRRPKVQGPGAESQSRPGRRSGCGLFQTSRAGAYPTSVAARSGPSRLNSRPIVNTPAIQAGSGNDSAVEPP